MTDAPRGSRAGCSWSTTPRRSGATSRSLLELRGFAVDSAGDGGAPSRCSSRGRPGRGAARRDDAGAGRPRDAAPHPRAPPRAPGRDALGRRQALRRSSRPCKPGPPDYLNKPCDEDELVAHPRACSRAARAASPSRELGVEQAPLWGGPTLAALRELLEQIADTDVTVLIQGESGVGKEIVARARARDLGAARRSVRQGELRGAPGLAPRERALRLRARRLHGRGRAQDGQVRARLRRHDLPRRDRRDERRAPGEAAPRAPGQSLRPARRQPRDRGRRPRRRGDEPRPRRSWWSTAASARTCSSGSTS